MINNGTSNCAVYAIAGVASVVLSTLPVQAQADTAATVSDTLEEIVVTAERRSSDSQKVATSLSVLSGANLLQEGKTTTAQMLEDVVGLSLVGTSGFDVSSVGSDMQGAGITIRGVASSGSPGGQILTSVPTTAVYADGIYEGIGGNYDVDRVEVLRGPQGTLYGRSATAGVVAIYSKDPMLGAFGSDISVEAGNYSLQHYQAAVNVPLGEQLAFRVSADKYEHDPYNGVEITGADIVSARAKLLYKPIDSLSILLGVALRDNDSASGGAVALATSPNSVRFDAQPVATGTDRARQYWANIQWDLGFATLTYIPALRTWEQDAQSVVPFLAGNTLRQKQITSYDHFTTHELRLASAPESKVIWQVGGFLYDNRLRNTNNNTYFDTGVAVFNADAEKTTKDTGVFGEATYPITSTTRLTGGLRYDVTDVRTEEVFTQNLNFLNGLFFPAPGGGSPGTPEDPSTLVLQGDAGAKRFYNLTYKARVEHDLSPDNMAYAMISTGFLPGDVQVATGAGGQPTPVTYEEETLTAYEVGSKNRFLADTLQINGALFHYRYSGYQTFLFADPNNPGSARYFAGPAKMRGAEIELNYLLTSLDHISFNYAYTDAYLVDKSPELAVAYSQSKIAGVAPHTVDVSYDHTFRLPNGSSLTAHADAQWYSTHDVAPYNTALSNYAAYFHVSDQTVGNLGLNWKSPEGRYTVNGYVRNVGDNRYKTRTTFNDPAHVYISVSAPRTWGVVASASF